MRRRAGEGDIVRPVDLTALPEVTAALPRTAPGYDGTGAFPHEGIRVAHEAALLTATVGAAHGGPGAGVTDLARILLALVHAPQEDTALAVIGAAALATAAPVPA
jgi:hypothetical protein